LSFNIDLYETSLGNVKNPAICDLYNIFETSFIKVYIKMTT